MKLKGLTMRMNIGNALILLFIVALAQFGGEAADADHHHHRQRHPQGTEAEGSENPTNFHMVRRMSHAIHDKIFAPVFDAVRSFTTGHDSNWLYLNEGQHVAFYTKIVVPMKVKCADTHFATLFENNNFAKEQKEMLCVTVAKLDTLFQELEEQNKKWRITKWWNNHFQAQKLAIRNCILTGLDKLKEAYEKKLLAVGVVQKTVDEIRGEVVKIANLDELKLPEDFKTADKVGPKRKQLEAAFKHTYGQLFNGTNANHAGIIRGKQKKEIVKFAKDKELYAFKLLCIGKEMLLVFNENVPMRMQWAYQQFAVNLAIYSLQLDPQIFADGTKGDIRTIADKWPIGILEPIDPMHVPSS